MVDTGGESALERRFLALVRDDGLDKPRTQRVFSKDSRLIARVDFLFEGGLVVEVAGHTTHSSRRRLQSDAQRHTELTLAGLRVITFTREDVVGRPGWVTDRLREGLARRAA